MNPKKPTLRAVTIDAVASHAGVSIKTVSRVMNREPAVREDTRQRVLAAAKELNYRPNPAARSLASSRSYFVALLYDNPSASYLMDLQKGALEACRDRGYSLLLQPCDYKDPRLVDDLVTLVTDRGNPGIVVPAPICDLPAVIEALDARDVKFVRIAPMDTKHPSPYVAVDDRAAAYDLARYLIDMGHQRIGFIKGHPDHGASHQRFEGFRAALRDRGIPLDRSLVVQGFFSFDSGEQCGRTLLARRDPPTAIFASNDEMAAGVLHIAHELGIPVPSRLSVAGFDDTPVSRYTWPSLTTIRQPVEDMAKSVVATLIKVMRDERRKDQDNGTLFPYELVIRGSTGPVSR
jgi:LacI family transcriptional regulator